MHIYTYICGGNCDAYAGYAAGVMDGGGDEEAAAAVDDEGAAVVCDIASEAGVGEEEEESEREEVAQVRRHGWSRLEGVFVLIYIIYIYVFISVGRIYIYRYIISRWLQILLRQTLLDLRITRVL